MERISLPLPLIFIADLTYSVEFTGFGGVLCCQSTEFEVTKLI